MSCEEWSGIRMWGWGYYFFEIVGISLGDN
jgi:hypothetical protein